MTVETEVAKAGPYTGNGVNAEFAFAFPIKAAGEIRVVEADADGVETELVLTTDYTVVFGASSGTVTTVEPLADGHKLVIVRDMEFVQETDFDNQGGYYPQTTEDAFDRVEMKLQQLREEVSRAIKANVTEDSIDDIYAALLAAKDAAASSASSASDSADAAAASAIEAAEAVAAVDTDSGSVYLDSAALFHIDALKETPINYSLASAMWIRRGDMILCEFVARGTFYVGEFPEDGSNDHQPVFVQIPYMPANQLIDGEEGVPFVIGDVWFDGCVPTATEFTDPPANLYRYRVVSLGLSYTARLQVLGSDGVWRSVRLGNLRTAGSNAEIRMKLVYVAGDTALNLVYQGGGL